MRKIVFLICYLSLIVFCSCSSGYTESRREPSTPVQVVDLFWKSSKAGDEDLVKTMVTIAPKSYFKQCSSIKLLNSSNDQIGLSFPDSGEVKREVLRNATQSEGKFGKFLNPETEDYSVYIWANLIFVNKYKVANISIEETTIYQDESRVIVNYRNPSLQEDFKLYFFLSKDSKGWKIFQIKDSSQIYTLINKNFGVADLICKE